MKVINAADTLGVHGRGPSSRKSCIVAECKNEASNRKEYCAEHLDNMPYIEKLSHVIAAREREIAAIDPKKWAKIRVNGPISKEIISVLQNRTLSFPKLIRELDLSTHILRAFLKKLEASKIIRFVAGVKVHGRRQLLIALERD